MCGGMGGVIDTYIYWAEGEGRRERGGFMKLMK
jgi:hypothetical protein